MVISASGYPAAFTVAAIFPLVAVAVIPVRGERHAEGAAPDATVEPEPARR